MSEKVTRLGSALLAVAAIPFFVSSAALADDGEHVVVKAGEATITAKDIEQRLETIPRFQLKSLGANDDAIRKRFVEQTVVKDLLYAAEAERRKLADSPALKTRVKDALRRALERELSKEQEAVLKDEELDAYYKENIRQFHSPRRSRLWRILVKDEKEAKEVLEQAKAPDGLRKWSDLARQHSTDAATKLRRGDLGFVWPDGQTDAPQVRVEKVLFEAADRVRDGELVPKPVKEGGAWAVIWRRGSLPAVERPLDKERDSIRQVLGRKRQRDAIDKLVADLRARYVKEEDVSLVDQIEIKADPKDVERERRKGGLPHAAPSAPAAASPPPAASP